MSEKIYINALAVNIINKNRFSHCRLCLKTIQDTYVKFQDYVSYPTDGRFKVLSEILTELLDDEISDEIVGVDAVCTDCVDKAVKTLQFLEKCKNATQKLTDIFTNLSETLNIDIERTNKDHSLYIVIEENQSQLIIKKNKVKEKSVCRYTTESVVIEHKIGLQCPQSSCEEDNLKDNQTHSHALYKCKACSKSFKALKKLQTHEKRHVRNQCPKCGKFYTTKEFYSKHVKLCMKNLIDPHPMRSKALKSHFCNECGKGYSTEGGLRVHNRFVHGDAKPHICKYCKKQFTAPSYLKVHMVSHTGEKNFKCDICGNKFVSKEALLYHTRRHTGEKPYSCQICQERFVNASARAEHIKFKHEEPMFMCDMCPRKFATRNFLKMHLKKHYNPASKLYTARDLYPPNMPGEQNMRWKITN